MRNREALRIQEAVMAKWFSGASPHRRRAIARGALLASGVLLTAAVVVAVTGATSATGWRLVGWNNLGMHCMDSSFSVFSILPPYNTVEAQLVDASGNLVKSGSGVTVTYQAIADPTGSINTTSAGKTDFWDNVVALFGAGPPVDMGLAGSGMPGTANVPQPMAFDASQNLFQATGIPITPYDDSPHEELLPVDAPHGEERLGRGPGHHGRGAPRLRRDGLLRVPRLEFRGRGEALRPGGSTTRTRCATTA